MHNSNEKRAECRIVVDAMGGDFAPYNVVMGAVEALKEASGIILYLTGNKEEILKVIKGNNISFNSDNIIDAPDTIDMGETPTTAIKNKPNSSIVAGARMVKDGKADAFVSAGNTGAMMAASTLIIGRIPGVGRPTIGALFPNQNGVCAVFDVGASVDSKPKHLLEYAIMGSVYVREIFNVENPSVGVLSVGEEDTKGSEVSLEASRLIRETKLNFKGNVEGRDILKGTVNVVVCDGFTGNIILKFGEGVLTFLKFKFTEYANQGFFNKLKIGLVKGAMKKILKDFDYQEFGGVPLLGVNGISIIGHGASTPKAIKNMVLRAKELHDKNLIEKIKTSLNQNIN